MILMSIEKEILSDSIHLIFRPSTALLGDVNPRSCLAGCPKTAEVT